MIALAQMVIREQRLRHAVAALPQGLVINAVRIPISTVVAEPDITEVRERFVEEST